MTTLALIAVWAGIIGLVLAVPLSIVGNILTPKVQMLWANRSVAARKRRAANVQGQLNAYLGGHTLEFRLECLSRGIYEMFFGAALLAGIVVPAAAGVYLGDLTPGRGSFDTYLNTHHVFVVVAGLIMSILCLTQVALVIIAIVRMSKSLDFIRLSSSILSERKIRTLQRELAQLVDNSAPIPQTPIKPAPSQE
jgi:hypothetical protein